MYKLYFLPGACSLATQVVLHELGQPVQLINKQQVADFNQINPVGTVPVLVDNGQPYREGAAIMLYLLDKHPNTLLPSSGQARLQGIQNILFANATMHPAYSRLFFIAQNISANTAQAEAYQRASQAINQLWQVVEEQLAQQPFLGGAQPSAADIMLTVYSRWGGAFPVTINIGPRTQQMLDHVLAMPSFQRALAAEQAQAA